MTDATLTSPTLAALATTAGGTAIATWGSYAIVLILLGWMLFRSHAERATLKDEIGALRAENASLNALRLQDAQRQTSVIESSTSLTTARTQGDQAFLAVMQDLAAEVASMRAKDASAGNRQLLEELRDMLSPDRALPRLDPPRRPPRPRGNR